MPTPLHTLQHIEQNRNQQSKILDLSWQNLLAIPPEVLTLDHLEELWLDNNAIQVVPADLRTLSRLRIIDLRRNPLREIADIPGLVLDWGTWQHHRDRLAPEHIAGLWSRWHSDDLIEELLRLPRLCWLDLSFNQLTALPESITRLHNLILLKLRANRLTALPESITRLQQLTALDLGDNRLTALPEPITRLQQLTSLDLGGNRLTALPEAITWLHTLTSLNLGSNRLTALPEPITRLQQLTSLDLGGNRLTALPEWLSQLHNLNWLSLENNRLAKLPASISRLPNLIALGLGGNRLAEIPEWLSRLQHLARLNLGGNQLTEIPGWISQLPSLIALGLGGNRLTALPEWLSQLPNLESLDLGNNPLANISESITRLQHLTKLNLWSNQLTKQPEWLSRLPNLAVLNLGGNRLTTFPEWLSRLQHLTALELSSNRLTEIPEWLSQLYNLTSLNLWGNQLTALPEAITRLHSLTSLELSRNQLTTFPEAITRLHNLTRLGLGNNQLSALPESITELPNLTVLGLDSNQLSALPESITRLQQLTSLDLGNNQLSALPESITRLPNLRSLNLRNNPIQEPPLEALDLDDLGDANLNKIHAYFRQRAEQGVDHLYEAKLLIVGEGGAGKTSLTRRIQDAAAALPGEDDSSKGIAVAPWSFPLDNDRMFRVNIWDFGGQEIYHSTHQFFLTKRSLYVLVADTRRDDTDFYWWLNTVELLSDNSPVFIVKNEKDDRFFQLDESALRGRFTNLKEVLSANLASNRGLNQILDAIRYHVNHLPHVGAALPKFWVKVREALENDPMNHINLDQYLDICKQQGFKRREGMLQLSDYLHDLGVCLHFQNDDLLLKTVILKPEWGTTAVYKVLDNNGVKRNFGRFSRADLAVIWYEDEYAEMRGELLRLMMNFKLCYELEEPGQYIAPQLLSKQRSDYNWDARDNLVPRVGEESTQRWISGRWLKSRSGGP